MSSEQHDKEKKEYDACKSAYHKGTNELFDYLEMIDKSTEEFRPRTFSQYERCHNYISEICVKGLNIEVPPSHELLVYITNKYNFYRNALSEIYEGFITFSSIF